MMSSGSLQGSYAKVEWVALQLVMARLRGLSGRLSTNEHGELSDERGEPIFPFAGSLTHLPQRVACLAENLRLGTRALHAQAELLLKNSGSTDLVQGDLDLPLEQNDELTTARLAVLESRLRAAIDEAVADGSIANAKAARIFSAFVGAVVRNLAGRTSLTTIQPVLGLQLKNVRQVWVPATMTPAVCRAELKVLKYLTVLRVAFEQARQEVESETRDVEAVQRLFSMRSMSAKMKTGRTSLQKSPAARAVQQLLKLHKETKRMPASTQPKDVVEQLEQKESDDLLLMLGNLFQERRISEKEYDVLSERAANGHLDRREIERIKLRPPGNKLR